LLQCGVRKALPYVFPPIGGVNRNRYYIGSTRNKRVFWRKMDRYRTVTQA